MGIDKRYIFSAILALITIFFHVYLVFVSFVPNLITRPLHLLLALIWIFLFIPTTNKLINQIGYAIFTCTLFALLYILFYHEEIIDQYGSLEGTLQYFIAFCILIAVLEMARRSIKLALPLTAFIALLYGFFGHFIQGDFGHQEIPLESFLGTLVLAEGGVFGQLTGISVNVVSIFVILGAFVGIGEGGNAFMNIAKKLAGKLRGGGAKVSVLASAFFGSISGSASANVASTGAFTIPTMKRLHYPSSLAASVEAVASTGGQIMPPLMGAGAFIMAELLGVNYTLIMSSALLPAILFFLCVWIGIDIFAKKYKLEPMRANELPSFKEVATISPFFLFPFGVLLYLLLALSKTPQYSASIAIFVTIFLLSIDKNYHFCLKSFFKKFFDACIVGSKQIASIAAIIICAGIIIGVLNITGVGVKITSAILYLSNGNLYLTLLLTAIACLILGMEVPTTAAYIICSSVCAPLLIDQGLSPLSAHLFIFWFALLSTITPPVCGTVFIASGIAGANWVEVAKKSMQLGIGLYLIPLSFIINKELINLDTNLLLSLLAFLKIAFGLFLISNSLINEKFNKLTKLIVFLSALVVIFLDVGV